MKNTGKRRIVFPTNTNNIETYHERMSYVFDKFGNNPFSVKELEEKFMEDLPFDIDFSTIYNTVCSLCSLGLFRKTDSNKYKITTYGRDFVRGSLQEDTEFYNNFLIRINQKYTCYVRNKIIKPYQFLTRTFQDLRGTVYKHELFPLFFVNSEEEYETYINTIIRFRNEHDTQLIVDYVQNLLTERKITLSDIEQVANRDLTHPINLLKTLGLVEDKVIWGGNKLELPGGYKISTETYYKFTEDGFDKYFSEEEAVEIYADEIECVPNNINEMELSINTLTPKAKAISNTKKFQRSKRVQAFALKRDKYSDFFKEIESPFAHPTPLTLNGKPKVVVHHMIPLKYQKYFKDKNLDVTFLCVCVCLICHDVLHDERNTELELKTQLIQYMYEQKKEILKEYLDISTYSEFAKWYNL